MTIHESSDTPKKRQLNPATLIWIAIFFFFIDYIVFHKPPFTVIEWLLIESLSQFLSRLITWLLVVIPLILIATAFFIWGVRGQFPWLDSYPISDERLEDISGSQSFMSCGVFVFMAVMATIVFFGK